MTYRLYAEEWRLTHTVTTGIFAIYPIVVVATLIRFGDLSDMSAAIANLTGPVGGPAAKTHGALCSNTFKEM